MALKPVLKIKVDELFLRWLSNSEVQVSLRDSLSQLVRGETVSAPSRSSSHSARGTSPRGGSVGTFVTPTSPKLPSPHSPRRPLHAKKQNGSDNLKVGCFMFFFFIHFVELLSSCLINYRC
ncbi:serine/threonine-protein phosphatase 2A regulatory subunit B subunit beta [Biomphalaria glabrata]|nr:serine/threonine-protein phosphatase 2A regulatory subunit B subunit beta [Biomphalaria glabrata]